MNGTEATREAGTDAPFRVLCLDGGGMRGVFTAAFVAAVEEVLGGRLAFARRVEGELVAGAVGRAGPVAVCEERVVPAWLVRSAG
jgi:hypothetical protein